MTQTRHSITRTITLTECNGQCVNEHGEFVDFSERLIGVYTPESATKRLRNLFNQTVTINNVEVFTDTYTVRTIDFVNMAYKKERAS